MVAGLAGGCSTATEIAGIPHAGLQPGGGYLLLASEQNFNCRRLTEEIELGLATMKAEHARLEAERAALPNTVETLYGRMFGGAYGGLKSAKSYRENEARVRALNRQLEAKGCHSVNVDGRILAFNLAPINGPASTTTTRTVAATGSVPSGSPARRCAQVGCDCTGRLIRRPGPRPAKRNKIDERHHPDCKLIRGRATPGNAPGVSGSA